MIKSKGYFEVIKLANQYKDKNIHFHFAGGWQNDKDEKDFFEYIKTNNLEKSVTFHGFVNGNQKKELFESSHIFTFPTRYKNEAFPLSVLEAFSYGLPCLSTDEGSIPFIIHAKSGVVINDLDNLSKGFEDIKENYLTVETAKYCRKRYLDMFSLEQFEDNLIKVLR